MPKKKLKTWNQRMLLLMAHAIDTDQCESQKDFCKKIGLDNTALVRIKKGIQGFTHDQVDRACRAFRTHPSWLYGYSPVMNPGKSKGPLQQLKDAVRSIEAELKN